MKVAPPQKAAPAPTPKAAPAAVAAPPAGGEPAGVPVTFDEMGGKCQHYANIEVYIKSNLIFISMVVLFHVSTVESPCGCNYYHNT